MDILEEREDGVQDLPNRTAFLVAIDRRPRLGAIFSFPRSCVGTKLECVAVYDNSAFNAFNPDPRAIVRSGHQTYQEMMNGFLFYANANEDLKLEVDAKTGRAKKKDTPGDQIGSRTQVHISKAVRVRGDTFGILKHFANK